MRGQISLDAIFAVTLITITIMSLVSLSSHEVNGVKSLGDAARLKVFAISLRDTVVQVYSTNGNFSVRKELPLKLGQGDWVNVTLNSTAGTLRVVARIGGNEYITMEKIPVFLESTSSVVLTAENNTLWVVGRYEKGVMDVRLSKKP